MAENKKSFIAYSDWHGMFKALPDEIAGKLIKHTFSYVNDENPSTDDFIINALFEQIKATLKRDLVKWDLQREQRSLAGKRSAEIRLTKSNERSTDVNETQRKPTVSVNVNDNVNVIVKDKYKFSFRSALLLYGFNENLVDEWLRVRKAKKAVNTETAFKGFITEIRKSNLPINKILEICVSSSWSGFKIEYLQNKNLNNGNNGNKQQTADERLQEAKSRILGEDSEFSESKPNNEDIEFTSFENVGNF